MKKFILTAITIGLSACGGGGGGSSGGGEQSATQSVVATINASDAMSKFLSADKIVSNLPSNDGYLGTASLSVKTEESYPFISNGSAQQTTLTKAIYFQRYGSDGRLQYRNSWKIHLDAQMKPIGMAMGHADAGFTACSSVTSKSDLPTSTNSSGTYLSGIQTTNYAETFRAGIYAHYCDPASNTVSNVEWSVVGGAPNPYFCLTMPNSVYTSKTRMCIPVENSGTLNNSIWIRIFNSDGTSSVDYKDTSLNKPIEQYSATIDSNNYWYGSVWRPFDGYVYQSYPDAKFSSQQACRDQTIIDWKKTWSAGNISWTCSNVQSR